MDDHERTKRFVLDFLDELGAELQETEGVFTCTFATGFRRKYGKERRFTFDPERRKEGVELLQPGSPLLKMLTEEARTWGALSVYPSRDHPPGSRVYTFQFESYSSVRKRVAFAWAVLEPGGATARVQEGIPPMFESGRPGTLDPSGALQQLRDGLEQVVPLVERAGRAFAQESVKESYDAFAKSMERAKEYFQGMKQDTFLEEARIRKRLGEINSKLYFTEDGLRELKLQQEQDRLTKELHALKKKNTQAGDQIVADRGKEEDKQRRRHEPKLRIRLVAATLVRAPPAEQQRLTRPPAPKLEVAPSNLDMAPVAPPAAAAELALPKPV